MVRDIGPEVARPCPQDLICFSHLGYVTKAAHSCLLLPFIYMFDCNQFYGSWYVFLFLVNRQLDCGVHGVSYGWMEHGFSKGKQEKTILSIFCLLPSTSGSMASLRGSSLTLGSGIMSSTGLVLVFYLCRLFCPLARGRCLRNQGHMRSRSWANRTLPANRDIRLDSLLASEEGDDASFLWSGLLSLSSCISCLGV